LWPRRPLDALRDCGARAVGADASERALAAARDRFGDESDVALHRADLTEPLTFADPDGFDFVFSHLVLGHVGAWAPVFDEFARVLAPGGTTPVHDRPPAVPLRHDAVTSYYDRRRIVVECLARAIYRSTTARRPTP
jgi:SAM-dependent methyltransferase